MKKIQPILAGRSGTRILHKRTRQATEGGRRARCDLYQLPQRAWHKGDQRSPVFRLSFKRRRNLFEMSCQCGLHARASESRRDQYAKYKTSVHAQALYDKQDLSAPTCNDCHGNHGATPPGIASVANVCGQCHARQAELFQTSPHKAAFDQKDLAECITCHSNHAINKPSDQLIGTTDGALCINCHTNGDKGFVAAGQMRSRIDELIASLGRSTEILNRAERAGMEVSKPKFELKGAIDALTHARVLIHSSSTAEVDKVIGPGLEVSAKGYEAGLDALGERKIRRAGLAVSLVFILFLAFSFTLRFGKSKVGRLRRDRKIVLLERILKYPVPT